MPETLFTNVKTIGSLNHQITRNVTRRDDGSVVVTQRDEKDDGTGGTPILESQASIEFSAAEWATVTQYAFTPPPYRVIPYARFVDRWTTDEMKAFGKLRAVDPNSQVLWERLQSREMTGVNLDAQQLIDGLAYVKQKSLDPLTPLDQRVWPDAATADSRIAAIRA